ncbi:hypothetical protein CDEST_11838 [Colletotrichum destructivum]|uniref:Uncharacterized protein n=1 Tax=Colletotrichum destructivum TaxID=34406 RepID=A0AAX4IUG4_9PEZI|nr:hypothetical protein CDEST_11838 [Colletotrichum destructivum]
MISEEQRSKRRREARKDFYIIIDKIRAKPDFQNFLLPPTPQELISAASSGPIIVVNTSYIRCDAFLIDTHAIWLLRLPRLKLSDFEGES